MLSPDLPKAMEKSSPAPSTGADLPLSRKGSARSFRHWGGERMTRSSTFDDLVCDFLEEEDAKEEATAPLSSAPGSDNELKNGGDMLLGRTDSGLAESVLRSAMAQMSGAEMMRLDADAAAVSRSTTSSDSSASDPALEDGMSKLHEAVQNAAGAHPGVAARPPSAAARPTRRRRRRRRSSWRRRAHGAAAGGDAPARGVVRRPPPRPQHAAVGADLGSLGLGLVQSYAASLTAAQQGAQNKPSSPFPAAAAPGAALDLSAGTSPSLRRAALLGDGPRSARAKRCSSWRRRSTWGGAARRLALAVARPHHLVAAPPAADEPGADEPGGRRRRPRRRRPRRRRRRAGDAQGARLRAADAANAAAAAAASAGGRAARQPVPHKGGQTMSAHRGGGGGRRRRRS